VLEEPDDDGGKIVNINGKYTDKFSVQWGPAVDDIRRRRRGSAAAATATTDRARQSLTPRDVITVTRT